MLFCQDYIFWLYGSILSQCSVTVEQGRIPVVYTKQCIWETKLSL